MDDTDDTVASLVICSGVLGGAIGAMIMVLVNHPCSLVHALKYAGRDLIARLIANLNDRASESLDAPFACCGSLRPKVLIGRPHSLAGRSDRPRPVAASLNGSPLAMTNEREVSNFGEKARWQPTPYPTC